MRTRRYRLAVTALSIFIIFSITCYAIYAENNARPTKPISKIKVASFFLADGEPVNGRVASEDRTSITVVRLIDARMIPQTINRNEIDSKIVLKQVSELDYWQQCADFFLNQVWDFRNDPDEFIQAIRCLEKARSIVVETFGPQHQLALSIEKRIQDTEKDRKFWEVQISDRAKLRSMELEAELDNRLKEIQEKMAEASASLDMVARLQDSIGRLEDIVIDQENRLTARLERLQYEIDTNNQDIRYLFDRGSYRYGYGYRYYYTRPKRESGSSSEGGE